MARKSGKSTKKSAPKRRRTTKKKTTRKKSSSSSKSTASSEGYRPFLIMSRQQGQALKQAYGSPLDKLDFAIMPLDMMTNGRGQLDPEKMQANFSQYEWLHEIPVWARAQDQIAAVEAAKRSCNLFEMKPMFCSKLMVDRCPPRDSRNPCEFKFVWRPYMYASTIDACVEEQKAGGNNNGCPEFRKDVAIVWMKTNVSRYYGPLWTETVKRMSPELKEIEETRWSVLCHPENMSLWTVPAVSSMVTAVKLHIWKQLVSDLFVPHDDCLGRTGNLPALDDVGFTSTTGKTFEGVKRGAKLPDKDINAALKTLLTGTQSQKQWRVLGSSFSHLMKLTSRIVMDGVPASEEFHCMLQRIKGSRHMIHPQERINNCLTVIDCPFVFAPARNAFCRACKVFSKNRPYVAYDRTLRKKDGGDGYGIGKGFSGEPCGQLEPYRMGKSRGCLPVDDPSRCIPGMPSYVNYGGRKQDGGVIQPYMENVPWKCEKPKKKGGACIVQGPCGGFPTIYPDPCNPCGPCPPCPPGCPPG